MSAGCGSHFVKKSIFAEKRGHGYIPGMRFFVVAILSVLAASASLTLHAPEAWADQTDPGLEALFSELRDGTVIDAEQTTQRIAEIWADAPNPTVDILYERASEALYNRDYALADELAAHITGLAPHFAQGWVLQANIKMALENRQEALDAYREALQLEPRHFIASSQLAGILYANGEERAAFELYQQALQWNPHYAPAREAASRLRETLSGQEI